MTWALLATAFGFGLRHGIDWDHIAAIADLTSAAPDRRRGFVVSMLYSAGHGLVVFVLGVAIITLGATLPASIDAWMGRVVGFTLALLGVAILVDFAKNGREFRLQSRWMLVVNGTFAGLRRVRNATTKRSISVEHEHDHVHEGDHSSTAAHDHAHESSIDLREALVEELASTELVDASRGRLSWRKSPPHDLGQPGGAARNRLARSRPTFTRQLHRHHSHHHAHELALPSSARAGYGVGTAAGIGMIHGVGFESPTQIAVFVGATAAAGTSGGLALLLCWVLGLFVANAGLALVAAAGLLSADRNFPLYAGLALLVAVSSIVLGVWYMSGGELG